MKSIVYKSLALATVLVAAASCSDNMEYTDVTPNPVTAFYEPANGKSVKLVPSATASLFFEWEAAHAADGSVPQYELAFYKADDTTTPIYKVTADNTGAKPTATVSHKSLTKVMAAAGVGMGDEGTIKWGVIAYSGANSIKSTVLYDLTLTRFIGFDETPAQLYITGAGSETGDNVEAANALLKPDADTFEGFAKLTAGQKIYFVSDKTDAANTSYSIKENSIVEGDKGETGVAETGVYRIKIDFSTASISLRKVDHVYMRFTDFDGFSGLPDNHYAFEFDYVGNGVYSKDATIVTTDTGWSWDPFESRHNFLMEYADGSQTTWGPLNAGNDGKPGSIDITNGDFTMVEYDGKVSNKWKLPDVWYNVPLTYTLYFNGEHGAFKHFATVK